MIYNFLIYDIMAQASFIDRCGSELNNINISFACDQLCKCGDSLRKVDVTSSSVEL
jgi:hypothetical protein